MNMLQNEDDKPRASQWGQRDQSQYLAGLVSDCSFTKHEERGGRSRALAIIRTRNMAIWMHRPRQYHRGSLRSRSIVEGRSAAARTKVWQVTRPCLLRV